jgi:hypothetical protein
MTITHNALELCCAETTNYALNLEAHLQTVPVELFPENHDIVEQSTGQVAESE